MSPAIAKVALLAFLVLAALVIAVAALPPMPRPAGVDDAEEGPPQRKRTRYC